MIAGLIGCALSTSVFEESKRAAREGADITSIFRWGTTHCIISIIFVAIIFIHIWQHWGYIKAVVKKQVYAKNKILTITTVLFVITVISITLYMFGFTFFNLHLHSLVTHFFVLFAIIHLVMNLKKFVGLIKEKRCSQSDELITITNGKTAN